MRGHLAAECRVRPPRNPAAVIQRIRPTSSEEIIGVAEQVTRRLIQAYAAPDRALLSYGSTSRRKISNGTLRAFAEARRADARFPSRLMQNGGRLKQPSGESRCRSPS